MGCDGCELWPGRAQVASRIQEALPANLGFPQNIVKAAIQGAINGRPMSELYADRKSVGDRIQITLGLGSRGRHTIVDVIRSNAKCYADLLGTMRAGHKGYAEEFEVPKLYPGRMATAARWAAPTAGEIAEKPWLEGLPRLVFISDSGRPERLRLSTTPLQR